MGVEKILRELSGLLVLLTEGWQPFPGCTRMATDAADDFANYISITVQASCWWHLQPRGCNVQYGLDLTICSFYVGLVGGHCVHHHQSHFSIRNNAVSHQANLWKSVTMLMIPEDTTIRIWDLESSLSDAVRRKSYFQKSKRVPQDNDAMWHAWVETSLQSLWSCIHPEGWVGWAWMSWSVSK